MTADLANLGLHLSFILSLLSSVIWIFKPILGQHKINQVTINIQILLFFITSFVFTSLIYSYIISDFSLLNVYNNSNSNQPLIYKIAGSWGNHEGSLLLYLWLLSFINLLFIIFSKYNLNSKTIISHFQSLIFACFSFFIILTSNPFWLNFPIPIDGRGLNPILQDIGLAYHPPILYLGYVLLSLPYSIVLAILCSSDKQQSSYNIKINYIKPWAAAAWSFLTLGIGLGSWWAYRELGWGGFWFWDPVENSSLMPWLTTTCLLHSINLTVKRNIFLSWTIFLSISSFLLTILGSFCVRSGIISSVHSFTNDTSRGISILIILSILTILSMILYSNYNYKEKNSISSIFSKEAMILFNNIILLAALSSLILGIFYPLIYQMINHDNISIGEGYFLKTFIPIANFCLFLAAIGINSKWQKEKNHKFILGSLLLLVLIFMLKLLLNWSLFSIISLSCSLILIISCLIYLNKHFKLSNPTTLFKQKTIFYSTFLSHISLAIIALSISIMSVKEQEITVNITPGQIINFSNFRIKVKEIKSSQGANFLAIDSLLYIENLRGDEIANLTPSIRYYMNEKIQTSESSIYSSLFYDLYTVSSWANQEIIQLKIYFKPLINWLWFGVILLFFSGILITLNSLKTK